MVSPSRRGEADTRTQSRTNLASSMATGTRNDVATLTLPTIRSQWCEDPAPPNGTTTCPKFTAALCLLALLLGSDSGDHTVGLIAAAKNLSRGAAQLRFAGMLCGSGGQGKCQQCQQSNSVEYHSVRPISSGVSPSASTAVMMRPATSANWAVSVPRMTNMVP